MKSLLGGISRFVSGRSESSQESSFDSDSTPPRAVENPESALVIFSNQGAGEVTSKTEPQLRDPPPVIHLEYDTLFSTPQTSLPDQEAEAPRTLDESQPLSFEAATKILLSESDSEPVVLKKEATKADRSSKRKKREVSQIPEKAKRLRSYKGKGLAEVLCNQEYDTTRFISYEAQQRYTFFSHDKDRFIEEKDTVFGDEDSLKTVIEEAGMLNTVTGIGNYDPEVVWEFWANFPKIKPESGVYEVLVRDWMYEVSASRVNQLFGLGDVDLRTHQKNVAGILNEVKNPFEENQVVGITNYIDLGFEIQTRIDESKTPNNAPDSSLQMAASWQANKNFLLKGKVGARSSTFTLAFKSWWKPSFTFNMSATTNHRTGRTECGFGLRVDNLREASYQRADPNFVMLTPNKEHLAEGIVWKMGKRPMYQSDVDAENFNQVPKELRPPQKIL